MFINCVDSCNNCNPEMVTNSSFNESFVRVQSYQSPFDNSSTWKFFKILVLCLITVFGLFGNSLVVVIFYKCKRMRRSTTNRFIFNMAVSDVLRCIFYLPINLASAIADSVKWLIGGDFGLFMCKLLPFVGEVTMAVSIQTLVLIAFDRFYAILFPMRKGFMTHKICYGTIILTWIVAMGLYSPIFYTAKLDSNGFCIMDWGPYFDDYKTQKCYYLSLFVLLYAVPLLLIIGMYLAIFIELRKNTSESKGFHETKRKKENQRILQMLVTVVTLFALTWAPLHVYAFLRYFYINKNLNARLIGKMRILQIVTVFTMSMGSAVNPFLYFIFLEKYRHNVKDVMLYLLNVSSCKFWTWFNIVLKTHKTVRVNNSYELQEKCFRNDWGTSSSLKTVRV